MIVYADLRQACTGQRDEPHPEHRHVQVDAKTYEDGRDQIGADLPRGWIVARWRVERCADR